MIDHLSYKVYKIQFIKHPDKYENCLGISNVDMNMQWMVFSTRQNSSNKHISSITFRY